MAPEDQEPRVRPITVRAERPRDHPRSILVLVVVLAVVGVGFLLLSDRSADESVEPTPTSAPIAVDDLSTSDRTTVPTPPTPVGETVRGLDLGDGSTVFDLLLEDGTRIGVWLPSTMGETLTREEIGGRGLGVFSAPALTLSLSVGYCAGTIQDSAELSHRGSLVNATGASSVTVCRPDQFLVMTIDSAVPLTRSDAQQLHAVPVADGREYSAWIVRAGFADQQCCQDELGPIGHEGALMVANGFLDGQVTALDAETLAPLWSRSVGNESFLHGIAEYGGEAVVVTSSQIGSVAGLSARTGVELWKVDLGDAFIAGVTAGEGTVWYLAYAYRTEGDMRAPRLRAVDVASGDVLWDAGGFEGTDWQWDAPSVLGDVVLMVDVPNVRSGATTASVVAFDTATGVTRWTLPLESPTGAFASGRIVTDSSRDPPLLLVATIDGDLVRIDAASGTELWRATTGFGNVIGLAPDVATFRSRFEEFDIRLIDGALP